MTDTHDLERRIERIERELGIDPGEEEFKESVESFASHSRVTIENVEGYTARLTISGDIDGSLVEQLERRFLSWTYNRDSDVFRVSGLSCSTEDTHD